MSAVKMGLTIEAVSYTHLYFQKSVRSSKHGSPVLRKTLFQIMDILIKTKPDDAVYRFMDKKRSEGKPYYVLSLIHIYICQ